MKYLAVVYYSADKLRELEEVDKLLSTVEDFETERDGFAVHTLGDVNLHGNIEQRNRVVSRVRRLLRTYPAGIFALVVPTAWGWCGVREPLFVELKVSGYLGHAHTHTHDTETGNPRSQTRKLYSI